ncbi:MAG: glycosyltransferase family 4 protein [Tepidisphaeraceae bacterium]
MEIDYGMRITFVLPPPDFSGGIRVVAEIAQGLTARGHSVTAVWPNRRPWSFKGKVHHLMKYFRLPQVNREPIKSYFDAMSIPTRQLETFRPVLAADVPDADVIVATWWETANWIAPLPSNKGVKAYFLQQYETAFGSPKSQVDATWRLPIHKIVCSKWLAEKAAKEFNDQDVDIVNNGIDSELFNAPPRGRQDVFTVGFLYDHRPVKGYATAKQVLQRVARSIPLRIIGIGTWHPSSEHSLLPNTLFAYRPEQALLPELYSRCDAWLCTSTSEGFHLPPHEAMACRTPVVSTKVGGPIDYVKEDVNGFLADIGDVDRLAERLVELARMPETRWSQFSDNARLTATEYSWPKAAEQMEAVFIKILGRDS